MKILQLIKFISVLFVFSLLLSCGSTQTDSQSAGSGRVSLLITDGPTNDFDQVNVTLDSISFIGEDDGHETVVFDETKTVNLLALENYSELLTTTVIPAGTYSKIRMHVLEVELVKLNPDGTVLSSDIAKLPANGKIDLNPREDFVVVGGGHLVVELDMDANKSIHIVETGKKTKYNFRPVVFVNILGEEVLKLVVLDGKVLARTDGGFQLCEPEAIEVNDNCMAVSISDDTVVQDDQILVVPAADVVDEDIVTVLGLTGSDNVDALHIVIASDDLENQNLAMFTGLATSVVDLDNSFGMETDDDNTVVAPFTALAVTLAEGARIFDEHGSVLTSDNIYAGTDVDVFGLAIPDLATVDSVTAAFVIIDNDVETDKVSGNIVAIDEVASEITITVVTESFSGDVCVNVAAADMFLLTIVDDLITSDEIVISDLMLGMTVDVYGEDTGDSCLSGDVVLVTGTDI